MRAAVKQTLLLITISIDSLCLPQQLSHTGTTCMYHNTMPSWLKACGFSYIYHFYCTNVAKDKFKPCLKIHLTIYVRIQISDPGWKKVTIQIIYILHKKLFIVPRKFWSTRGFTAMSLHPRGIARGELLQFRLFFGRNHAVSVT